MKKDTDEEMDTIIMPELESEESVTERRNQQGEGVKTLTQNQMFSKLSIFLAQLEAGSDSEELKNEIRQLLYSLYRSKNITKLVYNNLIKPIWINNTIIIIFFIIVIVIIITIIIDVVVVVTIKGIH